MKKFFGVAAVAASLIAAAPAMAADYTIPLDLSSSGLYNGGKIVDVDTNGSFTDVFSFTTPTPMGNLGASVITLTLTGGLSFTSVLLNGTPLSLKQNLDQYNAVTPTGGLIAGPNPQKLTVNGSFAKTTDQPLGQYSVLVQFRSTPAVPEPGTWALMILGFGVVGYAMRRRPSVRFAQAI